MTMMPRSPGPKYKDINIIEKDLGCAVKDMTQTAREEAFAALHRIARLFLITRSQIHIVALLPQCSTQEDVQATCSVSNSKAGVEQVYIQGQVDTRTGQSSHCDLSNASSYNTCSLTSNGLTLTISCFQIFMCSLFEKHGSLEGFSHGRASHCATCRRSYAPVQGDMTTSVLLG